MSKADSSLFTTFVNHNNTKSHDWIPSYWDIGGNRWAAILRCGWIAAVAYGELCHLGAWRNGGWEGSLRRLREAIGARTGKKRPDMAALKAACDAMVSDGILSIEHQGQLTIFAISKPDQQVVRKTRHQGPGVWKADRAGNQTPVYGKPDTGVRETRQSVRETRHPFNHREGEHIREDRQEGGAGGNHPGPEPPFEAQHAPPIHISECVSGAPPSTLMTPAGEEPVPGRKTVDGPGPAPPSDIVQAPPGVGPALANESGPALSIGAKPDQQLSLIADHEADMDQENDARQGTGQYSGIAEKPNDNHTEPHICANPWGETFPGDEPPPPDDDDLPDFEEEDEWQDFARESWERFLDRPIRFDPETGEPSLVPRSKEETAPVTADPEQAPAYSEESRPGDDPDPGEGSNGAIHNHYESEDKDEPDSGMPNTGGGYDYYRADDSDVTEKAKGSENADDTADSHPTGDPAAAPGDSGRRGGGEMRPGEDIDAKPPEPAPEPPSCEMVPGLPPGQMSLLGPAESQESPHPKKHRPTTPKEVTEHMAEMYQELTGRKARVLPKRVAMIGARLAEEFTLEDLEQALLGWRYCRFYQEDPGCRGVRAAGFIWPFTSADKVEKCMQRFVDEAPIEAVEAFIERTGRRIPEREAELAKANREREKQAQEDELLASIWAAKRQFDARREQAIFDKAYGRLMDDIRTARLYERQKPRQRPDEDIAYMWQEIRERAEVIGVLDELREKGLLPRDAKGKEESDEKVVD